MLRRFMVTIDEDVYNVWIKYQLEHNTTRDGALRGIMLEFAGKNPQPSPDPVPTPAPTPDPIPVPTPEPVPTPAPATKYNVEVSQESGLVMARSGTKILATCPASSDSYQVFKKAIDSVPANGTLGIGAGLYNISASYKFGLNPDGSNIFWVALPAVDKGNMKVVGAGVDKTIIRLLPNQRSPSRHVIMMLVRATSPTSIGHSAFEISELTFDGNRCKQTDKYPYDGEGLITFGSLRSGTKVHDIKLINSWASGAYLGNNGSGPGDNEQVWNIFCKDCGAEGIILDTCSNSRLADSESWNCREGFCLHGNTDWKSRKPDNVSAFNLKTDSQFTVRQVNDFTIDNLDMDCTNAAKSYGLAVISARGKITRSNLKSDKNKVNSYGGATYFTEESDVSIEDSRIEGLFGIHAIMQARVTAIRCNIIAPGGCFCTTDPDPVQSTIVVKNCTCSGLKTAMQKGATIIVE